MAKTRYDLETLRRTVESMPGATVGPIAERLGIPPQTASRLLEEARYAGLVGGKSESGARGRGDPTQWFRWFPRYDGRPPSDFPAIAATILKIADRHGRASIGEIEAELLERHSRVQTRAVIRRMVADGTFDVVSGLVGRPESVDRRTGFGRALTAFRALGRPFVRAEALRLVPDLPTTSVDTALLRGCELGHLVREGDRFRTVTRSPRRVPTAEQVLAQFPAGRAITLGGLRSALDAFNTRPIASIVAALVEQGRIVRSGWGAYALPGAGEAGELLLMPRVRDLLKTHPGRDWSAAEIVEALGAGDHVQQVRIALGGLHRVGLADRKERGIYRHSGRTAPLPTPTSKPWPLLRRGRKASPADAARAIRASLKASRGIDETNDILRATELAPAAFQAGLDRLVEKGQVFVAGSQLVSLSPPARLDAPSTPPTLRALASALAHGSIEAAMEVGAIGRSESALLCIRTLTKWRLLVRRDGLLVPNNFLHLEPLRKAAKATGLGALTPTERKVFAFVRSNPHLRKTDIAKALGIGRGIANRAVDGAVAKGVMTAREGRYRAVEERPDRIGALGAPRPNLSVAPAEPASPR